MKIITYGFLVLGGLFLLSSGINPTETANPINNDTTLNQSNDFFQTPDVAFWLRDIELSSDSFLVVDKQSRKVIDVLHKSQVLKIETGKNLKELAKIYHYLHKLDSNSQVKFVRGRKEFFNYPKIEPHIGPAEVIFKSVGVDSALARFILLIESPSNPSATSISGARGHFQLMPSVARKYGLVINQYRDDRLNFEKSAVAAAKLMRQYCIPQAQRIALSAGIMVDSSTKTELWFRLLVLHVYNAGAGTVAKAVRIYSADGLTGEELIFKLWKTHVGAFGNSSQNYSQVALASHLAYNRYLSNKKSEVYSHSYQNNCAN
ncbi:MAG: hypothetical protein RL263_746 [Bacteroidota bacterium]